MESLHIIYVGAKSDPSQVPVPVQVQAGGGELGQQQRSKQE